MKAFVYMPNWLGDAAMALAALNLLASKYELVLYGSGAAMALVEGYGERIIEQKGSRLAQFMQLRARRFDVVVNFKASISSRFLCSLLRARKKLFFYARKREQIHQVAKYAALIAPLGLASEQIRPHAPARYIFLPSANSDISKLNPQVARLFDNRFKSAQNLETEFNFEQFGNKFRRIKARNILAIAPGANYGSAKCYEDFGALAELLCGRFSAVLLLGAQAEIQAASALEKQLASKCKVINLCGKTSIKRLCAAISSSQLVLCNDSGIMHLCAMLDRSCAVAFGPTNPAQTAAYSPKARIFSTLLPCSLCAQRSCPKQHHECMKALKASEIAKYLLNELEKKN